MRNSDVISGTLIALFGVLMVWVIIPQWVPSSRNDIGPAFFPTVLSYGLIILGAGLCLSEVCRYKKAGPAVEQAGFTKATFLTLIVASALTVAYCYSMTAVGYLATSFGLFVVLSFLLGSLRTNPVRTLLLAAAIPVVVAQSFSYILKVYLP